MNGKILANYILASKIVNSKICKKILQQKFCNETREGGGNIQNVSCGETFKNCSQNQAPRAYNTQGNKFQVVPFWAASRLGLGLVLIMEALLLDGVDNRQISPDAANTRPS